MSLIDRIPGWVPEAIANYVKGFAVRFDNSPLDCVEKVVDFTHTRSSYIAQTALFGYLKTRMGSRHREIFVDETFSRAIKLAAVKVFAACLSDFVIHTVARIAQGGALTAEQAASLARAVYAEGLARGLSSVDPADRPADAEARFAARVAGIQWENAARTLEVFENGAADLVTHAPVIDEFKDLDREIVMNSVRFRWTNVREKLAERLVPAAVVRDWLAAPATAGA